VADPSFGFEQHDNEGPMNKIAIVITACFFASLLLPISPAAPEPETLFITIGSGDFTGVYFPTGLTIAKMINRKRDDYGIRATVESTRGSVFNVNAIMAGYMEFGLIQSDIQYQAFRGLGEWQEKGPRKDLRAVFGIHHESLCLVAAIDSGIETIADLKGKRVSLGNPGSGQYRNSIDALESVGLNPNSDIVPTRVKATEAPRLLQDDRIDAFFCTVGHPSETLREAVSGPRKVRFIPMAGPGVDKLVAENNYYTRTTVPVARFYPGSVNQGDVETFGVFATLCTSVHVPDHVVYSLTKEVFDNFDYFKSQHPAYGGLTKKGMLEGLTAPLHPGAMRYFKETGLIQ
jgi:hypothetical protein